MGWWVCFLVGWSQALEFYIDLTLGLDWAHTKLFDLLFLAPKALFQNHADCRLHCSNMAVGVGWLVLLVGALHCYDWLYQGNCGLLFLFSEHFHRVSAEQKGHRKPSVSSPPPCCKPHSAWAAVSSACPCGCRKDGSWLPPGAYSAGWAHSLLARSQGRQRKRTPPQDPS